MPNVSSVPDGAPPDAVCTPETDEELCARLAVNCDPVGTTDRCGASRTPSCGTCTPPESCGGGGRPNLCGYSGPFALMLGGAMDEHAGSIVQTRDGGYVIAGSTQSYGAGGWDVWVVRLDPSGDVAWERTYGGPLDDWGFSAVQTADGGFIVAGSVDGLGAGSVDAWVLKLGGDGDVEWQRTFGGAENDAAKAIRTTQDGGYVAAGGTRSFGAGDEDIWVLKLGAAGGIEWERTFGGDGISPEGGSYFDTTRAIEQVSDLGYFIAGDAFLPLSVGHWDGWALRLRPDGTPSWEKIVGGADREHFMDGRLLAGGSYVAVGMTRSFGAAKDDLWVVHFDRYGDLDWQYRYGGGEDDAANAVAETAGGGLLVAGYTGAFGADRDGWLLELDATGAIESQRSYGGPGSDEFSDLAPTYDGGFVALGRTTPSGASASDILVLKLDAQGELGQGCGPGFGVATAATRTETSAVVSSTNVSGSSAAESSATEALPRAGSLVPAPLCGAR